MPEEAAMPKHLATMTIEDFIAYVEDYANHQKIGTCRGECNRHGV